MSYNNKDADYSTVRIFSHLHCANMFVQRRNELFDLSAASAFN